MLNGLISKFYGKVQKTFRSEKGQTLVEHSLLLGIFSFVANAVDIFQNQRFFTFAVVIGIASLILLLFWKPRIFGAIVLIAVLIFILLFVFRWAEYGHV
jgi:hypothetical protein